MRASVRERSLVVREGNMLVRARMELDTKVCRFQSWLTRLARMLLILCSEAY